MQHKRGTDSQQGTPVVQEGLEFRRPSAIKSEVKEEREGVYSYEEERRRSLMTLKKPTKIASSGPEVRGVVEVKKEKNSENVGSTLMVWSSNELLCVGYSRLRFMPFRTQLTFWC